ncbi:SDR family NAD(P)-dependent oxidoreductase [Candidatus Uabimicrobium sp. HlEnr_7]|uniref:SDR family NAD(P)-dependent oxidoreductase n=1 Tax=Candidatus Uabimicrobium helgolandensis TaxID=3095367 RepID=UPI003556BEF9
MQTSIAVVGLSCRYPGAANLQQLWENILSKRQHFRRFPEKRMPLASYYDENPQVDDCTSLDKAAFIDNWNFDLVKWRIPQQTYESTDPTHWLALDLSAQALQNISLSKQLCEKTAVYIGNTLTGEFTRARSLRLRWPFVERVIFEELDKQNIDKEQVTELLENIQHKYKSFFPLTSEDTLAGSLSNTIAGRICNSFGFGGGGYTVDGACASSLLAVITAIEKLTCGEVDMAIAGGVDISLDPFEMVGFSKAGALAKGPLSIYDQNASGMMPGEGAGIVVLKRLDDAVRDNDHIYALVKGWGVSSDGEGAITAPKVNGQTRALTTAWKRAHYEKVDFIEGHGTGTTLGDRIELSSMNKALGNISDLDQRNCGVTSLKSIIGHTKAAAGIGAFIKATIAVNQRILPPTAGCHNPHSIFHEYAKNLYPIENAQPIDSKIKAGVSAMGFGGINAHVAIESPQNVSSEFQTSKPLSSYNAHAQDAEVIVLQGASLKSLYTQCQDLHKEAQQIADCELADLSCHLFENMKKGKERLAIVAKNPKDLTENLHNTMLFLDNKGDLPQDVFIGSNNAETRIGFMFAGQGSQNIGMARKFLMRTSNYDHILNSVKNALGEKEFQTFTKVLYPNEIATLDHRDSLSSILKQTKFAQPAICLSSLLHLQVLKNLGITPQVVCGHSLGELTALQVAGAFSESHLLELATQRGIAMNLSSSNDGMLSLRTNSEHAAELILKAGCQSHDPRQTNYAVIANKNHHQQTIVAGNKQALSDISNTSTVSSMMLPVSRAFHSKLMLPSVALFSDMCSLPSQTSPLNIDFISGIDGKQYRSINIREYLQQQITSSVDFVNTLQKMASSCDIVIEVGGGRVLSNIAHHVDQSKLYLPVESTSGTNSDLCKIIAVLFSRGVVINSSPLFKDRIIHPYIKPQSRNFLINPCEQDANSLYKPIPSKHKQKKKIDQTLAHDPLLDLRQHIASVTGFPFETIKPQHRLLDDLNLDSIKAAEIISVFSRQHKLQNDFEPTAFTNATLETLAQQASADTTINIDRENNWVHSFVNKWKKSTILNENTTLQTSFSIMGHLSSSLASTLKSSFKIASDSTNVILILPIDEDSCVMDWLKTLASKQLQHLTVIDYTTQDIERSTGIQSFVASLQQENTSLHVNFINVSPNISPKNIATIIAKEYNNENKYSFCNLYYNDEQQRHESFFELTFPDKNEQISLPKNVVLVSGGAKGITAECVRVLTQKCSAKLVLLGRSPIENITSELKSFAEQDIDFHYLQCDICNENDVKKMMSEVNRTIGKIDWIIHGAGINIPRRAASVSIKDAQAEIAPKLYGLQNLLKNSSDLSQVIVLTSVIGVTGMAGNAWYAFANESARRTLAIWRQNNRQCKTCCLAFSIWDEIGMGAKLGSISYLEQQGIKAIPVTKGVQQFIDWSLAADKPEEVVICSSMGKHFSQQRHFSKEPIFHGRFIDNIIEFEPQIKLVTECALSPKQDPYLNDHVFDGKMLFPTVFGLEAMAQGVQFLYESRIENICFNDIKLTYPIVVNTSLNMRIQVQRISENNFECSLHSADTNYELIHFSATVTITETIKIATAKVNTKTHIKETQKLYETLLFQGPLFQRIAQVNALSRQHCDAKISPGVSQKEEWYHKRNSFVLGDPYQRDALLQMGQLMISPRVGLPIAIDSINIKIQNCIENIYAQTILCDEKDKDVEGNVVVTDINGNIIETLQGYRIRVLRENTSLPCPENLITYLQGTTNNKKPVAKAHGKIFTVEDHERGTRGEVNFLYRFPMRFAALGNPSGSVHFATYAHWIGETREVGIRKGSIYEKATRYISDNNYAWITKETNINIIDSPLRDDFIEVECWNERLYGTENASLEMMYRFYACRDDFRYPLAEIAQTTTWAQVISHGIVKPTAYPKDMLKWIQSTLPRNEQRKNLSWKVDWAQGPDICITAQGPQLGPILSENTYRTTPRHANFVGNIYWSNYADWMGEVRDLWLQDIVPYGEGELRCTATHTQHLREAMPGDTILVRMHLQNCKQNSIDLQFNFYKITADEEQKLATASHTAYWFSKNNDNWQRTHLPQTIIEKLT